MNSNSVGLLLLAFLFAGSSWSVRESVAQDPSSSGAQDSNIAYESIDSITKAVYESISGPAGQDRDWDFFRTLFAPGARLIPLGVTVENGNRINPLSVDDYVAMVSSYFVKNGFFEREIHRTTEQFGSIAHHFSTYESRRTLEDVDPFARGINSFQLMHDGTRWWIVTIFWQAESPEVQISDEYLN